MRIHICFAVLALAAIVACGGGGEETATTDEGVVDSAAMQRSAAAQIQPGMSQEEVRNTLGEPRTRVTMDGGFERWTYYSYDAQGVIANKTLLIFGNDGKVVEINR